MMSHYPTVVVLTVLVLTFLSNLKFRVRVRPNRPTDDRLLTENPNFCAASTSVEKGIFEPSVLNVAALEPRSRSTAQGQESS